MANAGRDRMAAGISNPPLTGQQLWVEEPVRVRAPSCPWDEKSSLKADESTMINGMKMQKATGNHCIKDPYGYP